MTTQTERALSILRERILNGTYRGGERLLAVPLAEALQISRTPVRAALSRLSEEGLLDRTAGSGFEVRSFSYGDAVDTLILRGILEGTAARLAAERGADHKAMAAAKAALDDLDTAFADGSLDVDSERYGAANLAFHATLPWMAGSAVLARELDRIMKLPFASPSAFLHAGRQDAEVSRIFLIGQVEHRRILDAIAERDGGRAEAITREHARTALRDLQSRLSDGQGRDGDALAIVSGSL